MINLILLVWDTWPSDKILQHSWVHDYMLMDVLNAEKPNEIIENQGVCNSEGGTVRLIFIICTRITNKHERHILRKTWLSKYIGNKEDVRYVFLVGRDKYDEHQPAIEEENRIYGDLTQGNFIDSYSNLTLKTIMGFRWASTYCANAEFVMKVDDDVFVNVKNLLCAIKNYADDLQFSIGGLCVGITKPSRKLIKYDYRFPFSLNTYVITHKHDVPYEEYPGYTYPPYCSGTGYITSSKIVKDIYDISRSGTLRYLRIEDVFVGICIKHLGYKLTNIDGFAEVFNKTLYQMDTLPNACTIISVHQMNTKEMMHMWYSIADRKCS